MEKEKKIKKSKSNNSLSKKELRSYIINKLDKLSWEMGEKKYSYRENLHKLSLNSQYINPNLIFKNPSF
ncbi:MAG: hypothetical protein WAR79_09875 [Melioribacteraceae bacterium]